MAGASGDGRGSEQATQRKQAGRRVATGTIPQTDWAAPAFIGTIWLASLAALGFVVWNSSANIPLWDEWQLVPVLTRTGWPSPQWLWASWSEHRVPLNRVLLVGLFRWTGDFRTPLALNVCLIAGMALVFVWTARLMRGSSSYADAFFPLLLMHPGHEENLLQGWDLQNALFLALAGVLLLIVVLPGRLGLRRALAAALVLGLLAVDGAGGIALVPAMLCWLLIYAFEVVRRPGGHRAASALCLLWLVGSLTALVVAYFQGLDMNRRPWPGFDIGLLGTLMSAAGSFGPAARVLWPASGAAIAIVGGFSVGLLTIELSQWRKERLRFLGIAACYVGFACIALGIGFGRTIFRLDYPLEARYALLGAPALCLTYFVGCWCRPHTWGRLLQNALLILVCVAFPLNWAEGLAWAGQHRERIAEFVNDLRAGVPSAFLLSRHDWLIPRWNREASVDPAYVQLLATYMVDLRRAGIGPFQALRDTPPNEAEPLAPIPSRRQDMIWQGTVGHGLGPSASATFSLRKTRRVYGIVLSCAITHGDADSSSARMEVSWSDGVGLRSVPFEFPAAKSYRDIAVWIDRPIADFTIRPDKKPCLLSLARITLLIPPQPVSSD